MMNSKDGEEQGTKFTTAEFSIGQVFFKFITVLRLYICHITT